MNKLWMVAVLLALGGCETDSAAAPIDDGILVIGDSTSAYTHFVQQELPCVSHAIGEPEAPSNDRDTWYVLAHLDGWLAGKHYRIVQVNAGLWDISHRDSTPEHPWRLGPVDQYPISTASGDYEQNVGEIISKIQATGAKAIWATMTNVPKNSIGRLPEDAVTYNRIAKTVARAYGARIDDLYSFMLPHTDMHVDQKGNKVHFSKAGYKLMASHVAQLFIRDGGC